MDLALGYMPARLGIPDVDRVLTVKLRANSFRGFRRFRGFRVLRAGKRQPWTPIRSLRSHCCGLVVPVGMDRAEKKPWIWPWGCC